MKKTYIISNDVKVPMIVNSGQAHRPPDIRFKTFRKGQLVQGELKHQDNKPAFVLVGRMGVLPLTCVQEVTSIPVSGADGKITEMADTKKEIEVSNKQVKYGDGILIGALIGLIGVHLAQKYNYIDSENNKLKLYGALGGGILGMYLVYRSSNKNNQKPILIKK
jgi:hypothetical protein